MTIEKKINKLIDNGLIEPEAVSVMRNVVKNYPYQMTDTIEPLLIKEGVRKQFVPSDLELQHKTSELEDPIGDEVHTKVKGIVHRYQDRCLLLPLLMCPIYCRFCFRRESVGDSEGTLTPTELHKALDYIERQSGIWEVILSGGDPLMLKPKSLKLIFERLQAISHVQVIRIHTRVPLVSPQKISGALLEVLDIEKALFIVLHTNHADEFTPSGIAACRMLQSQGITMLSQTTFLKGVNDSIDALKNLMQTIVKHRIKPYYLHHLDRAPGTDHFRIEIEKAQELVRLLRCQASGLCQPEYMLDIPGGYGKVPIGPSYLCKQDDHYIVTDREDKKHRYDEVPPLCSGSG